MERMNGTRILTGGLLTGLLMNLFEFAEEPLTGAHVEAWLRGLGLQPPGESAMVTMVMLGFATGILSIWLYAAFRPRFGAGARTAILAGVTMWMLSCGLPNIAMAAFGMLAGPLFWMAMVFPLISIPLATLAGAWVYREGTASVVTGSTAQHRSRATV